LGQTGSDSRARERILSTIKNGNMRVSWMEENGSTNNDNGLGKEEKNPGVKGEGLREALEGLHEDGQESFQQ
jgi:hypothetical protein